MREDQIQRYGRQVLLREVGGKGQRKLLSAAVAVLDTTPVLDVAATYLAAGGSPLITAHPPLTGFLATRSVASLNPDVETSQPTALRLGSPQTPQAEIVAGAAIAFRSAHTCAHCWTQTVRAIAPSSEDPVVVGSLAALVTQHLVLFGQVGFDDGGAREGTLSWGPRGLHLGLLARCAEHPVR